jgi:hypothetical protein
MLAVLTLLAVVMVSMLITKVAAIALSLTGMSRESARFQARSAFSRAGFTTTESEAVVGHPVRRRIVMHLILLGNAGLVTLMATLLLSFAGADTAAGVRRAAVLVVGLLALFAVTQIPAVDRALSLAIERFLHKTTDLDVRDYASLLHLSDQWRVAELEVEDDDWLTSGTLAELDLPAEGVLVLGIERHQGTFVGAPEGPTQLRPGDRVLLYGQQETLEGVDRRRRDRRGRAERQESVLEHRVLLDEQEAIEDEVAAQAAEADGDTDPAADRDTDREPRRDTNHDTDREARRAR